MKQVDKLISMFGTWYFVLIMWCTEHEIYC